MTTNNLHWYPQDFPSFGVEESLEDKFSELTENQKLLAIQKIEFYRLLGQNDIRDQNSSCIFLNDLLPPEQVGYRLPEWEPTALPPTEVPHPRILIIHQDIDYGVLEVGDRKSITITLIALDDELELYDIYWEATDKFEWENALTNSGISPATLEGSGSVTIEPGDYRTVTFSYVPQQEETLSEEIYIISNALNYQNINLNSETYQGLTINVRGSAVIPEVPVTPTPPPAPPVVNPPVPPVVVPSPEISLEDLNPTKGTWGLVVGGVSDGGNRRKVEMLIFSSESIYNAEDLTRERHWLASFGNDKKAYMMGGRSGNNSVQHKTGDIYHYASGSLYRTSNNLQVGLDFVTGSETILAGYLFGGNNLVEGNSNKIYRTEFNIGTARPESAALANPLAFHQCSEGTSNKVYLFGGATVSNNNNFSEVASISSYNYSTRTITPEFAALTAGLAFRVGAHSNGRYAYIAGGTGQGFGVGLGFGIQRFFMPSQIISLLGESLVTPSRSPAGLGTNKTAYFCGGDPSGKAIQKLDRLEEPYSEGNETLSLLGSTLNANHNLGSVGQTANYSSGW